MPKPCTRRCAPALIALLLAACGGGGGDPAPADTGATPATAPLAASLLPAPATRFDLSPWKLTLPVDRDGGSTGAAQTLLPATLVAGYASPWFQLDAAGNLVFTAPANGATTTPGSGSDHTRSELREFSVGTGFDAKGDWTGRGTLAATGTIRAAASLAPTLIIGQLRSETQSLAMVVWRPSTGQLGVDMYERNDASSPHTTSWYATGFGIGQSIDYVLAIDGGALTATVNGTTRSFALDASWVGAPLYFKLGAYHTVASTGNPPGDATVVAFSRFAVTH